MRKSLFALVALLSALGSIAQDTVWVQTFTHADQWKRRGTFKFPAPTEKFRKVLMLHTLKCYPGVSGDGKYACGEWDYLTYNMVYDHRGKMDSTYQSGYNFRVAGANPVSYVYTNTPQYDLKRYWQYQGKTGGIPSSLSYPGSAGTESLADVFGNGSEPRRYQFLIDSAILAGMGTERVISQLGLNLLAGGDPGLVSIRMKHNSGTFGAAGFNQGQFTRVYFNTPGNLSAGTVAFPFYQSFTWNGKNDIVVEISVSGAGDGLLVRGHDAGEDRAVFTGEADRYYLQFAANGAYAFLDSNLGLTGAKPRTYEFWCRADAFNDGGPLQAGINGSVGQEFSLRTTGTSNTWRVQQWGTPDFDVTVNNSLKQWRHFALTYDGSTTRVYVDGILAGSKAYAINTGKQQLWLGRWSGSWFKGGVNGLRVWNKALSQSTLAAWYNKTADASHPDYSALLGDFGFEEGKGIVSNGVCNGVDCSFDLRGGAWWGKFAPEEMMTGLEVSTMRPDFVLHYGFNSKLAYDSTAAYDTIWRSPVELNLYGNPANKTQVPDNAANHPSKITSTQFVWAGGYRYTYDENGKKLDSTQITGTQTLTRVKKEWYSPTVAYEIGRYITPYGIGLTLGNGWTWTYDVTDYWPILQDSVDLAAGNNQELLDLKFAFIRGEAPAEVLNINQVWDKGVQSYSYANLSNNKSLADTSFNVHADAGFLKVRSRITGHGHNSNDGNYPHCCEWKNNQHTLYANGQKVSDWHVWQETECAENPLYPQGGTWPGSREGWCPGDKVKDFDFNVTSYAQNNRIRLDYEIEPVPSDNLGMGGGNYVMAMQLFQYKKPAHTLDAEVYEVMRPSTDKTYSRVNPACFGPKVVVRNTGSTPIKTLHFTYWMKGGRKEEHVLYTNLGFLDKAVVELPIRDGGFWENDGSSIFNVVIDKPNWGKDEYSANDTFRTVAKLPDVYAGTIVFTFQANNASNNDNRYYIRNEQGNIVAGRTNMTAGKLYHDTLKLFSGCYTLEVQDDGYDGLSYWANSGQGNGYCRIRNPKNGATLKNFGSDFGKSIWYSFAIISYTSIQDRGEMPVADLYPNPNSGSFSLELNHMGNETRVEVSDITGRILRSMDLQTPGGSWSGKLDLQQPSGVYLLRISSGNRVLVKKVVVE